MSLQFKQFLLLFKSFVYIMHDIDVAYMKRLEHNKSSCFKSNYFSVTSNSDFLLYKKVTI